MNTPTGKGFRSLNVALRQTFCLYSCVRPVKKYPNVPSPLTNAERVDMVIFRENTEDVYAGLEFPAGSPQAIELTAVINRLLAESGEKGSVPVAAGIGIKPITQEATARLMKRALQFAVQNHRPVVTIVHKGNIQKFTEGAFREWAYEVALGEFRDQIVTEDEVHQKFGGKPPAGKIVVNDRIADNIFQQTILYPERYSVLVAPNLNGDYLSDQVAALVGGLGIAPGANIGDHGALFEATHGTAPDIAGKNLANPSSLVLSAAMMLEYLGWTEAAQMIERATARTFTDKIVTGDFRKMEGARVVGTREFGEAIVQRINPNPNPRP
jgi:isocitrate dehydrogenase